MKKFNISIHCNMEVLLTVEAENEEQIKEWVNNDSAELYSAIEFTNQMASNISLGNVSERENKYLHVDVVIKT